MQRTISLQNAWQKLWAATALPRTTALVRFCWMRLAALGASVPGAVLGAGWWGHLRSGTAFGHRGGAGGTSVVAGGHWELEGVVRGRLSQPGWVPPQGRSWCLVASSMDPSALWLQGAWGEQKARLMHVCKAQTRLQCFQPWGAPVTFHPETNSYILILQGLKYPGLKSFAPDKPGEIFLMDLNEEKPRAVELRISRGFDLASFNPHGISTYIDKGKESFDQRWY